MQEPCLGPRSGALYMMHVELDAVYYYKWVHAINNFVHPFTSVC